jgi:hypothetical protein
MGRRLSQRAVHGGDANPHGGPLTRLRECALIASYCFFSAAHDASIQRFVHIDPSVFAVNFLLSQSQQFANRNSNYGKTGENAGKRCGMFPGMA